MRLHSLHLKNFRGVADRRVEFPQTGVVIVQGPNEVGKTSMMEGLDLLLNEKDSAKKAGIKAVKPVSADVGPAVTAEISAGAYRFTYSKQWLKSPETLLQITQPKPESLTGAAAHDRVTEILAATVDLELFAALQVLQGRAVNTQADLRGNSALRVALEAASGTVIATDASVDHLTAAIESEFLRYFTARGKNPTAGYRAAITSLEASQNLVSSAQNALTEAEDQILRHDRLTNELAELAARIAPAEKSVTDNQKATDRLKQHEKAVDEAHKTLAECAEKLRSAQGALDARDTLREQQRKRTETAKKKSAALVQAKRRERDAEHNLQQHIAELEGAVRARDLKIERVSQLEQHAAYLAREVELARDTKRFEDAKRAAGKMERAEKSLARYRINDDLFEQIRAADQQVQIARALLNDSAAQVAVAVNSTEQIMVDGDPISVEPQSDLQLPVSKPLNLGIGSNVRIAITPARGGEDRLQTLNAAEEHLKTLLREADVADLESARAANTEHRKSSLEKSAAENQLVGLLGADTLAGLEERVVLLEEQVRAAAHGAEATKHDSKTDLVEQLDRARIELVSVEKALASAHKQHAELEKFLSDSRVEAAGVKSESEAAAAELLLIQAELAEAESAESSESLEVELTTCEQFHKSALATLTKLERELEKQNPELVQANLENSQEVLQRLNDDHSQLRDEITRSQGQLELMGAEGRQDALDDALTALESAQQHHDRIARRAAAARVLHETVQRHQSETWQRYIGPFQKKIISLGRFVFGADVHFEVTPELEIEARTLKQETVPFASLSTGAQEQIGILSRLACAQIVSQNGGVPVMIDDALGNTDPSRLAGLGTVLAQAGKSVQVIVLTCTPERYREVGGATVVRL